MIDLSRYDEAEADTWPNCAPMPEEARRPVRWTYDSFGAYPIYRSRLKPLLEGLKSVAPCLLSGLGLGLLPFVVGFWIVFVVDYWYLGALMYALGVAGGALLTGVVIGVVGCLCLRRIR
jgi:hypothetical protein